MDYEELGENVYMVGDARTNDDVITGVRGLLILGSNVSSVYRIHSDYDLEHFVKLGKLSHLEEVTRDSLHSKPYSRLLIECPESYADVLRQCPAFELIQPRE